MKAKEPSEFGKWLKIARTAAGLSQAQLAELTELHRTQIAFIETGRTQVPFEAARQRIIQILGDPPPHVWHSLTPMRKAYRPRCSFCAVPADSGSLLLPSQIHKRVHVCADCLRDLAADAAQVTRGQSAYRLRSMSDKLQ